jgi:nicotinate-nucleotide adenylyltransferase
MVALACAEDPRFEASAIEAPRPDGTANFTVGTLDALRHLNPTDTLFNLVGADSFLTLPRWRSPSRLLEVSEWIVVSRPGTALTPGFLDQEQIAPLMLTPALRARVHLLTGVHEDVSATELRQRLHAGDPCRGLLPRAVAAYIQSHNLYR